MLTRFLLSTALLLTLASCDRCKNPEPEPTGPEKFGKLSILWKKPFEGSELFGCVAPAIYENRAIFSNFNAAGEEFFYALDADNGDEQFWKWQDFIGSSKSRSGKALPFTYKNVLVINPNNGLIGVDMLTGKTLWKQAFPTTGIEGQFEKCIVVQSDIDPQTQTIRLVDMENGNVRNVFTIDSINTPFRSFATSTFHRETTGDTLMYTVFNETFQRPDGSVFTNAKAIAYNVSQNKLVWQKSSAEVVVKPIVINDKLYLSSDSIYCRDRQTGEILWKTQKFEKSDGFWDLYENRLVIVGQGSGSRVHAYDPNTGALAWSIPHGGNTSHPLFYKGIMYFTSASDGRLWAVRVSDGQRIWHEESPDVVRDPDAVWSWGVNIDTVRNRLYGGSFRTAYFIEPAK